MCFPISWVFALFWSENGYTLCPFWSEQFLAPAQKGYPGGKVPFLKKKNKTQTTQKENEQEMSYPYWYSTKHSVFKKSKLFRNGSS